MDVSWPLKMTEEWLLGIFVVALFWEFRVVNSCPTVVQNVMPTRPPPPSLFFFVHHHSCLACFVDS